MLKIIDIFLTLVLSFSSLNFTQSVENSAFIDIHHSEQKHELVNNRFFNACAIVTDNAFQEVLSLNHHYEPNFFSPFAIQSKLSEITGNINPNYLKTCSLIDLNFSIRAIIFPFHSFL